MIRKDCCDIDHRCCKGASVLARLFKTSFELSSETIGKYPAEGKTESLELLLRSGHVRQSIRSRYTLGASHSHALQVAIPAPGSNSIIYNRTDRKPAMELGSLGNLSNPIGCGAAGFSKNGRRRPGREWTFRNGPAGEDARARLIRSPSTGLTVSQGQNCLMTNKLVRPEAPRVYKGAHSSGQNGNPGLWF